MRPLTEQLDPHATGLNFRFGLHHWIRTGFVFYGSKGVISTSRTRAFGSCQVFPAHSIQGVLLCSAMATEVVDIEVVSLQGKRWKLDDVPSRAVSRPSNE